MDFMALLKQMMTPAPVTPAPRDIRPPAAGGPGMPGAAAFPGFAKAMGAGMTGGQTTDSPMGAAANAFTAARDARGAGPSIMDKLMAPATPPPMDIRPPAAGGPGAGFMDKLGLLLGAL